MNQVTERKRLRQEYLQIRSMARGRTGWVMFGAVMTSINLLYLINKHQVRPGSFVFEAALVGYMIFLLAGLREIKIVQNKAKRAYVPPATAADLPAEEVLVRGSNEPPDAQSNVLLRAAAGQETPKEELLRVSSGEKNEKTHV